MQVVWSLLGHNVLLLLKEIKRGQMQERLFGGGKIREFSSNGATFSKIMSHNLKRVGMGVWKPVKKNGINSVGKGGKSTLVWWEWLRKIKGSINQSLNAQQKSKLSQCNMNSKAGLLFIFDYAAQSTA